MFGFFKSFRNLEDFPQFDGHSALHFFNDRVTGLRAVIAIYNDNRGPALGATRMWPYASDADAIQAALNLSKTMAYKSALAGLPYGGGKGVIIGDSRKEKTKALLAEYARQIHGLGGRFMTGTDVGLTDIDVAHMREVTPYMIGVNNHRSESPSEMAGLGVFHGITGVFEELHMNGSLAGKKFAVKGLGKTGGALARLLIEAGGEVIAADIDREKVAHAKKLFPKIKIVSPEVIHKQKVDVFAPCALGGDLNNVTVKELQCVIVAGTENNQLESPEVGDLLYRLGILYVPDYVINAGGLIDVVDELESKGYSHTRVLEKVKGIKKTVRNIIARSRKEKKPTHRIADQMAKEILNSKKGKSKK